MLSGTGMAFRQYHRKDSDDPVLPDFFHPCPGGGVEPSPLDE
jgi:hypothetical protein